MQIEIFDSPVKPALKKHTNQEDVTSRKEGRFWENIIKRNLQIGFTKVFWVFIYYLHMQSKKLQNAA